MRDRRAAELVQQLKEFQPELIVVEATGGYQRTVVETLIQSQYQQTLKRGKLKKVALTACMRKFLTILNAMLRDQQPFRA